MNRAEMRAMLKDCLQEPAASDDQYSTSQLNVLLNRGLLWVQMKVVRINPAAFLAVDSFGVVADKNIYPVPTGSIAILKLVRSSDGKRIAKRSDAYMDVKYGPGVGENLTNVTKAAKPDDWSPFGRYMRLGPTPNATASGAILVTYTPSLTMADDSTVPGIAEPLHDAIVNRAWQLGLRPNADVGMKAAAGKALDESMVDFTDLAGVPSDGAFQIIPDFDSVDGLYGAPALPVETR